MTDSINTSSMEMEMDLGTAHDGRSKIDGKLESLSVRHCIDPKSSCICVSVEVSRRGSLCGGDDGCEADSNLRSRSLMAFSCDNDCCSKEDGVTDGGGAADFLGGVDIMDSSLDWELVDLLVTEAILLKACSRVEVMRSSNLCNLKSIWWAISCFISCLISCLICSK